MLRVSNKHQPFLCRTFSQAGNLFEGRRVRQHQLRRSLPGIAGGAAPRRRHRNSGKRARDFGARGGVQRKAAQTASGEERTSKSVLSCGQFLDKVSIDGMAKPRGKSVKSTVNYIQKSCQLGKNSWGLAGRLQFPLQTSPFCCPFHCRVIRSGDAKVGTSLVHLVQNNVGVVAKLLTAVRQSQTY